MQNWRPPHKQERQTNETARAAAHSSSRLLEYDELAARLARRARADKEASLLAISSSFTAAPPAAATTEATCKPSACLLPPLADVGGPIDWPNGNYKNKTRRPRRTKSGRGQMKFGAGARADVNWP